MPAAHMSTRLEDTSAVLGEYMLKGWTLTDLHCDQCQTTPLMREPSASASAANRARIQFCALCDGSPAGRLPSTSATTSATPMPGSTSAAAAATAFHTAKASQPDPSESISTLLLQGYSLLGDNCSNPSCRGIPLVGYPKKKDGTRDGRKMCVACGGRWVDGSDLKGMTLMSTPGPGPGPSSGSNGSGTMRGSESPRSRARREMYGLSSQGTDIKGKQVEKDVSPIAVQEDEDDDFDLGLEQDESTLLGTASSNQPTITQSNTRQTAPAPSLSQSSPDPILSAALTKTSSSLAKTLERIANSLDRHTESDREEGRYFVDVKLHTEAIKDVMTVMSMVKQYTP